MTLGEHMAAVLLRVDWQRVVLDLRGAGMPAATVASHVGSSARHVQRLARGEVSEPRIRTALRLLDLHADRCPQQHSEHQLCRG